MSDPAGGRDAATAIGWPDGFRLVEAGREADGGRLRREAADCAAALRAAGAARLAVAAGSVRSILVGLAGGLAAGCDVLVLRGPLPDGDTAGADPGADHRLEPSGALVRLADAGSRPARPSVILTTSGTTGAPKRVAHDPRRLCGRVSAGGAPAVWLLTFDPGGFAGLQVILSAALGGHRLVAAPGAPVGALAQAAADAGVTHVSATPSFWRSFLVALGGRTLALRAATLGGETADQAVLDAIARRFPGAALRHIYASTEAGAVFAVGDGRAGFPAAWLAGGIDGAELRVTPAGTLAVRSPRAARDRDGWIDTGDRVAVQGDRVLFLGRADAVVNVGGVKVSPEAVEAVILEVPGVRDAAVRARANPITGMLLTAEIVADPRADRPALEAAVRARLEGLEPAARPRLLRFVGALALSAAGKKDRGGASAGSAPPTDGGIDGGGGGPCAT